MFLDFLIGKQSDLLFSILTIFLTLVLGYWYTQKKDIYYYLNALINEIRGNIFQLTETEFNKTLDEVLSGQRKWLAKGISIRVASGSDEGYLYQYLLDHAYTIFATKGYVLALQESEYVKGGIFDDLAEFYLNCVHFNVESFFYEKQIVDRISHSQKVEDNDLLVIKLKELRKNYSSLLNNNMKKESISNLEGKIWDFEGEVFTVIFISVCLFVIFS